MTLLAHLTPLKLALGFPPSSERVHHHLRVERTERLNRAHGMYYGGSFREMK